MSSARDPHHDRPNDKGDAAKRFFALSDRVTCFPVLHGSADYALAVRDEVFANRYDCIAVPLPDSFREEVIESVKQLPEVRAVVQSCDDDDTNFSYVPIDPAQAVIRAIRMALQERIALRFIDLEVRDWRAEMSVHPDPYALKSLSPMKFAAAVLPALEAPKAESMADKRARHMAFELHKLELDFERILFLPSMLDWVWIKRAFDERAAFPTGDVSYAPINSYPVDKQTLSFFLGELPYITHLYERFRHGLDVEQSLGIDGVKELLVETRDRLSKRSRSAMSRVTLKTMRIYLQYVRNLTLLRRRLRPDLFTLIEAAKQVFGDDYAIELIKTAKDYPEQPDFDEAVLRMAPGIADIPEAGMRPVHSRLPGDLLTWRNIDLHPEPEPPDQAEWTQVWNPQSQCSHPPEDIRIESFNRHVREQAKQILTSEFAHVEKFRSSVKDGIDIRETLRNWHTGDIYVRELPPSRSDIDVTVFLFDVPAETERYPWRSTWFAEHQNESTLVFFATNFMSDLVGPGIAKATYGGAFFIYPPRPIVDIWQDPAFNDAKTLEERLLTGAFAHAKERHVAVVSPGTIKASWRKLARRYGKSIIHLPLNRFSTSVIDRLRTFHVLNGKEIRSYAADYIRRVE
ncbi:MAG: hypothetical protein V3W41_17730 [Planctomycetota bacterium]